MEEFPQYDLYSFSRNKIAANQITDEYCDNHCIIILKGNKLISYNRSTPDVIIKEGVINTVDFLPEDIEILKNGIEVTSQNELLEYFESLSS